MPLNGFGPFSGGRGQDQGAAIVATVAGAYNSFVKSIYGSLEPHA
jgi:hypothetical protein